MVKKATAVAHTMQGLLKYHGLKDHDLRIPFHDSISVNLEALWTKTTVEFGNWEKDSLNIDGRDQKNDILQRALSVINRIRSISNIEEKVTITSENSLTFGEVKGLGFSSSAGAALAAAAFKAAKLDSIYNWDLKMISKIARRLAGSACRSVVGEYAYWHAGDNDDNSFAEKIATKDNLDLQMLAIPIASDYTTEIAHKEVITSNFFQARIDSVNNRLEKILRSIINGNLKQLGKLVEEDSLELHALTMTGKNRMILLNSKSLQIIQLIKKKQKEGKSVFFSMQTGPSVFVNGYSEDINELYEEIVNLKIKVIKSKIGGSVRIIN